MLFVLVSKPWNTSGLPQQEFISLSQQDGSAFLVGERFPSRGALISLNVSGNLEPLLFHGSAILWGLRLLIQVAVLRDDRGAVWCCVGGFPGPGLEAEWVTSSTSHWSELPSKWGQVTEGMRTCGLGLSSHSQLYLCTMEDEPSSVPCSGVAD